MEAVLRRFLDEEEAAALLEYGMLVLLVALLCIVAVKSIGSKVNNGFETADTQLP